MRLIARRSTIFKFGDIVWVPFPFVEAPQLRNRPALVASAQSIVGNVQLIWVLMITSAANRGWPDDVSLEERFGECGLAVPCVIRTAKISTVEAGAARKSGALPADLLESVKAKVVRHLGF